MLSNMSVYSTTCRTANMTYNLWPVSYPVTHTTIVALPTSSHKIAVQCFGNARESEKSDRGRQQPAHVYIGSTRQRVRKGQKKRSVVSALQHRPRAVPLLCCDINEEDGIGAAVAITTRGLCVLCETVLRGHRGRPCCGQEQNICRRTVRPLLLSSLFASSHPSHNVEHKETSD